MLKINNRNIRTRCELYSNLALNIIYTLLVKEKDTEFDDFIILFLKPALSDWYKLESGDAILGNIDVIGYEIASCRSVDFSAITPNDCLSSFSTEFFSTFFLFVICFNI